jgi:hypothetical protein
MALGRRSRLRPQTTPMNEEPMEQVIRHIDSRLSSVEQILPKLATREEMHASIAAAVAPLATREEMHAAIDAAVAPLATREEMRAEGERYRLHATTLFEDVRDDNRIILEHLLALSARVDALARR